MGIFKNRPLCAACMSFMVFAVIGYFVSSPARMVIIAFAAFVLVTAIIFHLWKKSSPYTSLYISLVAFAIMLSTLVSYLYYDVKQSTFEEYYDEDHTIEAVVVSVMSEDVNFNVYEIEVRKIDGDKTSHKSIITLSYNSALDVGDLFTVEAQAHRESPYYPRSILLSDGIFIIYESNNSSSLNYLKSNVFNPKIFFKNINLKLSSIFTSNLGEDAGALSSALLLGNKDLLSDVVRRDFYRAGASHILALSGLHVSILMGALAFLLKRLRVGIKKIAIILSVCSVTYLLITGVSLSACRAVIMILCVYMAILFESRNDSLTSLSLAGALILLFSPGSVLDAGFWMSFSATLGLLVYMPAFSDFMNKCFEKYKEHKIISKFVIKPLKFVLNLIATGICAMIPLLTVICIFVGEISLYSIISSVVLSIPTTVMIILSMIYLVFSSVPLISNLLSLGISYTSSLMIDFCAEVSDIEHVVLSLNYPFMYIAIIVIGITVAYSMIFKLRNVFIALTPYAVAVLLLILSISAFNYLNKDIVTTSYINGTSQSDMLVVSNDRESVIIDIGTGSNSAYFPSLSQVAEERATEIQAMILTKCSSTHPSTLINLFSNNMVRELWLPYPKNDDEYYLTVPVVTVAKKYGVDIYIYEEGKYLQTFDSINIEIYRDSIERSAVPVFAVSINCRSERLVYVSPAFNECENADEFDLLLEKAEYVIFGNRGPLTKTLYTLPENCDTELVVFSDETRAAYFDGTSIHSITYVFANEPIQIYIEK